MAILNNPMGALSLLNRQVPILISAASMDCNNQNLEKAMNECKKYISDCHQKCQDKGGVDIASCAADCFGDTSLEKCSCTNKSENEITSTPLI